MTEYPKREPCGLTIPKHVLKYHDDGRYPEIVETWFPMFMEAQSPPKPKKTPPDLPDST